MNAQQAKFKDSEGYHVTIDSDAALRLAWSTFEQGRQAYLRLSIVADEPDSPRKDACKFHNCTYPLVG